MTGVKPLPIELVERVLHGGDVQPDEVAEQVGEARAREPDAALDVDHAAREVEVVARLPVELRLRAMRRRVQLGVLLVHAVGGRFVREVRQCQHRRLEGRVELAQLLLERREAVAQLGGRRHLGCCVAPGALGLADRLRGGVALRAQLVDLRLQGAPLLVQREHLVQLAVRSAAGERCAHALGLGADQADVEHGCPA